MTQQEISFHSFRTSGLYWNWKVEPRSYDFSADMSHVVNYRVLSHDLRFHSNTVLNLKNDRGPSKQRYP